MTASPRELRTAELLHLAQTVASELVSETGDTWTAEPHPSADVSMVYLTRATDGARLSLRMSMVYAERGRLVVEADEPAEVTAHNYQAESGRRAYVARDLRATFAIDRPARAIARETVRRILPRLAEETERVRAEVARHTEHQDATEATARRLAEIMGGRVHTDRDGKVTGTIYGGPCRVDVSGDRVSLDRLYLDADTAAAVLAVLVERKA